jgi:hypothetical protein
MIDDSQEPFKENASTTKRVVEKAHPKAISVEEDVTVDEGSAFLTNPDVAVEFVKETGCDSLAGAMEPAMEPKIKQPPAPKVGSTFGAGRRLLKNHEFQSLIRIRVLR